LLDVVAEKDLLLGTIYHTARPRHRSRGSTILPWMPKVYN